MLVAPIVLFCFVLLRFGFDIVDVEMLSFDILIGAIFVLLVLFVLRYERGLRRSKTVS